MKKIPLLLAALSVACLLAAQDLVIQAGGNTYKLMPPSQCQNSTCIKGIIRIGELAGPALAADLNSLKAEAVKAEAELTALEAEFTRVKNQYVADLAPYEAEVKKYSDENDRYTADVASHNERVRANNSLPGDQRSSAEVSALQQNKVRLDQWLDKLTAWKANLDTKREVLAAQYTSMLQKREEWKTKAVAASGLRQRIILSLEQLKKCDEYSRQAASVAKTKGWGNYNYATDFFGTFKVVPGITSLDGWAERMKKWSSLEWD